MKIKIKALADIEFLSAKVDRKHNIIHVQARNLLDSTGQDCTQCHLVKNISSFKKSINYAPLF